MTKENALPEFTVLIAVYGGDDPARFHDALLSVFENSLRPTEIICVVDGPVGDPINSVLNQFQRSTNLVVKRIDENIGLAGALNIGLQRVSTDWVVRADADDVNSTYRFLNLMTAVSKNSIDVVGSAITELDDLGAVVARRSLPENHKDIVRFCSRRNPINHMSVCYRTELVRRVGGYPKVLLKEDYALWAMLIQAGATFANLRESYVDVHGGMAMYVRRGGLRYAMAEAALQMTLVRCGIKSTGLAMIDFILRGFVFLLPAWVRGRIYENFLRAR